MFNNSIKRIALTAITFVVTVSAFCVPAKRVWHTMNLTDGTAIEVMMVGDEHGHWYVDHNGKTLRKNDEGKMEYLTASQFDDIKAKRKERVAKSNAMRMEHIKTTRALSAATSSAKKKEFGKPTSITGKKHGIVILVNYSDKTFLESNTQELFDRRFNEEGYSQSRYVGSVHDYFYDQSYGKFDLTFDVVGPVTVSKTHDYYGENTNDGNDKHAAEMVIEAIRLADQQGVDFSQYDWDGDGEVDQVFVIYAGTGEASSGTANDIWPHEYGLSAAQYDGDGSGTQTLDGVKIDTYACSCELASSTIIDGIGTACHEFSHCLGYADLYDTDYSGGQGMERWDLLCGGAYNGPKGNGEVPAAYTSFERWWAGWMDLTVLDKPQIITDMPALNDTAVAYKIVNDAYPNEYYLLENRQAKKWDSYTACPGNGRGYGLLILHVDYDENAWTTNTPNDDPSHQRMTFFPADNNYGTYYSGDYNQWSESDSQAAGDAYPGTTNNSAFTDDSQPAATLYNANSDAIKFMNKPITDISMTNRLISFTFMGNIESPTASEATEIGNTSFTANWSPVDGAESYDLEVTGIPHGSTTPVLTESFSDASGVYNSDISNMLDEYTTNDGWTGAKIYPNNGCLKIGSSKYGGYILSPTISIPASGSVTVKLNAANYIGTKEDNSRINIKLLDASGNVIASAMQIALTSSQADYVYSFNDVTSSYQVRIEAYASTNCRFNLYNISVYDGKFTAADLTAASSAKTVCKAASTSNVTANITDTHYSVTDLTAGTDYRYRVRANVGENHSSWSHFIKIETSTGINNVTSNVSDKSQRVFNLNGQNVGTDINKLPQGIYIIGTRKYIKK